jgi:hypothetical protein
MDSEDENNSRPDNKLCKPAGWRSAKQLNKEYVGGNAGLNNRMGQLRKELIADMRAAGYTENEAADLVEEHLIGKKKPYRGRAALAASPDAVRALELIERTKAAPLKPIRWRSAAQLSREGAGSVPVRNNKLDLLREVLIADVQAAGYTEVAATTLVEEYFVGWKKPPPGGPEALAASPDAVRVAEQFGMFTLKEQGAEGDLKRKRSQREDNKPFHR